MHSNCMNNEDSTRPVQVDHTIAKLEHWTLVELHLLPSTTEKPLLDVHILGRAMLSSELLRSLQTQSFDGKPKKS